MKLTAEYATKIINYDFMAIQSKLPFNNYLPYLTLKHFKDEEMMSNVTNSSIKCLRVETLFRNKLSSDHHSCLHLHCSLNIFYPFPLHVVCLREHFVRSSTSLGRIPIHRPPVNKLHREYFGYL